MHTRILQQILPAPKRMDPISPNTQTPIYQESKEKNAKWLWLLIVIIIIGGLVFAFIRGIGPFSRFKLGGEEEEELVSPEPFTFSSPSPISGSSPSPSPSADIDKSKPKISVLNGSGKTGAASAMKDFLEGKGYTVVKIGNADNSDYDQTELLFKEDFKKYESALTGDLSSEYSVTTGSEELDASSSADIEVIIGAK